MAKGTSGRLKTPKEATDIDGTAIWDRNLVTMSCRVNEGDKMALEDLQKPSKAQLHHEDSQRDENANEDVPDAHGCAARGSR